MKENNLCLRNLCENTLSKLPIFFVYKKNIQNMLEYWPYATRKKTFFFDETGYFNTEFVSPQYKKYKPILSKIGRKKMRENHIFLKK